MDEIERLQKIIRALMDRAERSTLLQGSDFSLFQTAVVLEDNVRQRTAELEAALRENERITRQLRELQAELREQSTHDALTGLCNRRFLEEALERELARSARTGDPVAVVMADIDHFKAVNDRHGHLAGDAVLRAVAEVLPSQARAGDLTARYGGEEFVLVLPGMSAATACERAEALRAACAATAVVHDGASIRVTASFGVAVHPQHGATADEVIGAADRALYEAKAAGRDRVVLARLDSPTRGEVRERPNRPHC